ncbi:hypothetical protein HY212_05460 [Candidatus Pacearchaeota archaeon]|nr:hypothetical protein [Candidatus Pacearchaeota archaeon]
MELRDILGFPPEVRRDLIRIYGPVAQTWSGVKSWDDCVIPEEKSLTSDLKEERKGCEQCPYFRVKGSHFNYCGVRAEQLFRQGYYQNDEIPSPNSAEYNAHVDHFQLQLWCLQGVDRYNNCINFKLAQKSAEKIDSSLKT